MPVVLFLVYPCGICTAVPYTLFCGIAGTIIVLPFMVIPSITAILSLNDQHDYSSFCTSAPADEQPHNTYSDSISKFSLTIIANLISSAVMQFGVSVPDSIAFMVMLIPGISTSLFFSRLCLDSQAAMKSCGPGLHRTLLLY